MEINILTAALLKFLAMVYSQFANHSSRPCVTMNIVALDSSLVTTKQECSYSFNDGVVKVL